MSTVKIKKIFGDSFVEEFIELERENVNEFVQMILGVKQWRTTSRTNKCRLISSVERSFFKDFDTSFMWNTCRFDGTVANYKITKVSNVYEPTNCTLSVFARL